MVERTGRTLESMLTTSNPWRGRDCEREACLACDTKERTGKDKTQDCSRRNLVYETWCLRCEDIEIERIDKMEDKDDKEKDDLKKIIRKYKYVGETSRSLYERGFEHRHSMESLRADSHMLKHAISEHEDEDPDTIKFGIRTLSYCRTSFVRQITEACNIQGERRRHILLNSRAEYNRSAVPRLMTKLGEKEYEKFGKEKYLEKIKDDIIDEKIRKLRKARNLDRRPQEYNIENKRRKIDEENSYEEKKGDWGKPSEKKAEKRVNEDAENEKKKKKMKQTKIGDNIPKTTPAEMPLDNDKLEKELEELAKRNKGDDRFYDLETINKNREKERIKLRKLEKERKEKAEMLRMTWDMARICKEIISQNGGEWRELKEKNEMERKDSEEKELRLEKSKLEKEKWRKKNNQRRIDNMIEKLNEKRKEEWESIKDEEERKIRKEKQEMQENLWKWRSNQKVLEKDPREKLTSERKITILEELLEKEKKEKEKRIEKIATEKIKWQTIREERKQERKERLEKQEKLQNGWKNIRWALKEMKNVEDSSDYLDIKILAEKSTLKHLNKQKLKFKTKYKKVFQSVHNLGSILEMNQDESNSMEDGILDDGDRLVLDAAMPDGESPHPEMN